MRRAAAVAIVALLPLAVRAQEAGRRNAPAERDEVVATIQKFFDAMAAHDTDTLARLMMPDGRLFSTNDSRTATAVRVRTHEQFIAELQQNRQKILERIWNPEVRVQGGIATLWANYDFHLDGKFSHCGIDAFELVKTEQGWRIAGGVFTIERKDCAPSPLGEPK